jgi:hypothetical protein
MPNSPLITAREIVGRPYRIASATSIPIPGNRHHVLVTGSAPITSIRAFKKPDRVIRLFARDGVSLQHTAYATATNGQMSFSRNTNLRLAAGDSVELRQLDSGAWVELGRGKTDGGVGNLVIAGEIDLPAAAFVNLPSALPANAVLESAQIRIITAATAAGNTTRLGLGPSGAVVKYGVTASLVLSQTINTFPAFAQLSAPETVRLNAVQADGTTAGTGNFSAGRVKYRLVYKQLENLPA